VNEEHKLLKYLSQLKKSALRSDYVLIKSLYFNFEFTNTEWNTLLKYLVGKAIKAASLSWYQVSSKQKPVQDLLAVTMKSTVFWAVTPCSLERDRRFGGTYRLHFQGRRVSQAWNQQLRLLPASVIFLFGLLFISEDGGDMFPRNVWFSPTHTALHSRRSWCKQSSLGSYEKVKFVSCRSKL
jgi:hypothetical protein